MKLSYLVPCLVLIAGAALAEDVNVNLTTEEKAKSLPPIKCSTAEVFINGDCNMAMAKALKRRGELQEETGAMIADGRCDDAMKLSLKQGDFAMAEKVRDMCATLYPVEAPKP